MPLVVIQSRNPASPRTASIDQSSFGAPELDNLADVLEGQIERRLPKLLHELSGVCIVARGCQSVVNGQRQGQVGSDKHDGRLTVPTKKATAAASERRPTGGQIGRASCRERV